MNISCAHFTVKKQYCSNKKNLQRHHLLQSSKKVFKLTAMNSHIIFGISHFFPFEQIITIFGNCLKLSANRTRTAYTH